MRFNLALFFKFNKLFDNFNNLLFTSGNEINVLLDLFKDLNINIFDTAALKLNNNINYIFNL